MRMGDSSGDDGDESRQRSEGGWKSDVRFCGVVVSPCRLEESG